MATAEVCGGGAAAGAELRGGSSDEDELYPPFCEQPSPSQMHKYSSWLQGPDQQGDGYPAAEDGGVGLQAGSRQLPGDTDSQEEQGSEEEEEGAAELEAEGEPGVALDAEGEEAAPASEEDGGSPQGAGLPEHWRSATAMLREWCDTTGLQLPAWLERQQPCGQAPQGGPLAGHESLAVLPDTPQHLLFAVRAMLEVRGDPAIVGVTPPNQLAADQLSSQFLGITQDGYMSQDSRQLESMLASMGADAGEGYYLFRIVAQAQLNRLWALALETATRLAEATGATGQQQAGEQAQGGSSLADAEAVAELHAALRQQGQELEAALVEKQELLATVQRKEEELTREMDRKRKRNISSSRERAVAAREAAEHKLKKVTKASARRETELQQQLQEAGEAAAEREIELEQQIGQVAAAAADRQAELEQELQQVAAAAAEREAELRDQLQQVTAAAAAREAELQEQLEQVGKAAAEQEAELQQHVQQAQRQAEEVCEDRRQLRRQLAELQQTRQQELAEADEQQEAAATEQRRLAAEAQRWEARCQAAEQRAAQKPAAVANAEHMAAERDAAVAGCHRLQQELAAAQRLVAGLQQENTALRAASADLQQAAATAKGHAQEAQATACGCRNLAPAIPTPEPQVACGQLSHEQRRELKRFLADTDYQHTKLGAAFPPLHALRSPSFWRGVAEGLQAPEWLVREEGARLLAELALAGQRAAEAAAREAQRSERLALKQAERLKAVVEVQHAATAQQAVAGQKGDAAANGDQQRQEPQGGYTMWELLMELGQREAELLEAQTELEREREASSCKAWQLVHEAQAQHDAARQRVRQLEAQLAQSQGDAARLRQLVAPRLRQVEEGRATKRARGPAAAPAGGWALREASDGCEDWPAGSGAEQAATAAIAQPQAAGQGQLADEGGESQATEPAARMATTRLRQAEQGAAAEQSADSQAEAAAPSPTAQLQQAEQGAATHRSVPVEAEPAAAAAQLQRDGQPSTLDPPGGASEGQPVAAASSTMMRPEGQPAGWQRFMTRKLRAKHGAFAPLMAQALAIESDSGSRCGAPQPAGSRKRGRAPAAA